MNYNVVVCMGMQEAIGWALFAGMTYVAWRLYRTLRKGYRSAVAARSEAFSNAVSEAVASGVAQALSAAVADATAAATGGSVNVHIGNNLARLIADHYDGSADDHDDNGSADDHDYGRTLHEPSDRRSMGSLPDATRRGESESRRPIRRSIADRVDRGSVRVSPTDRRG